MRTVLERLGCSAHVGLAYDVWAPFVASGKIDDQDKGKWLDRVRKVPVDPDYAQAFERWHHGFDDEGLVQPVETSCRLLVGHGNPSAADVGLTVHHTWGVPIIPGSALKGVLASYVANELGGDDGDSIRSKLRGPQWKGGVIVEPPGELYAALFGMPEVTGSEESETCDGWRGTVCFHDALLIPQSGLLPLARDVITVHQKPYYDGKGHGAPPADYHDPNPVSFLTVRKGVRFLLALTGPEEWTALAMSLLLDALATYGVGSKTTSGYGRMERCEVPAARLTRSVCANDDPSPPPERTAPKPDPVLVEFLEWVEEHRARKTPGKQLFSQIRDDWFGRLVLLPLEDRKHAGKRIRQVVTHKKAVVRALTDALEGTSARTSQSERG